MNQNFTYKILALTAMKSLILMKGFGSILRFRKIKFGQTGVFWDETKLDNLRGSFGNVSC